MTGLQQIEGPLSEAAVFLVLTIKDDDGAWDRVRTTVAGSDDLLKNVLSRDLDRSASLTVGIGASAWDRLVRRPAPKELHPFRELRGTARTAVSTPGDLIFHVRASRRDLCYELTRQIMLALGDDVTVEDDTIGFRYFDGRDLLGFVDGTANPIDEQLAPAAVVGEEDPDHAGGSYLVVQKYLHELTRWDGLGTAAQEQVIGRTKAENIELPDADHGQKSHKTLNTITVDGVEYDILRDNMPFGSAVEGDSGTYFIGYSRRLWVTERMLERMFLGDPPGMYDRILDVSRPVTGTTFFVPASPYLLAIDDGPSDASSSASGDLSTVIAETAEVAAAASAAPGPDRSIPDVLGDS